MTLQIILTGNPIRVRKRSGVVKHMFYDPQVKKISNFTAPDDFAERPFSAGQDVRWFKPAELVTEHGLRGHIRESVGTHGLYKASFSGPIKQNDTVMLVLYKRIYPKIPEKSADTDIFVV